MVVTFPDLSQGFYFYDMRGPMNTKTKRSGAVDSRETLVNSGPALSAMDACVYGAVTADRALRTNFAFAGLTFEPRRLRVVALGGGSVDSAELAT